MVEPNRQRFICAPESLFRQLRFVAGNQNGTGPARQEVGKRHKNNYNDRQITS